MITNNSWKVAHITLSMGTGGLENLIVNLANKTNSKKYTLTVGCLDSGGELLNSIHEIGCSSFLMHRRPGIDWRLIFALATIFKKHKFHVIHTHNQAAHFYGGLAAKLAHVPVLVTTEHSRHNSELHFRRRLEKRVLCAITDKWITVSDELAELAVIRDKLPINKVAVIYNGIDIDRFRKPDGIESSFLKARIGLSADCFIVSIVARLHPIKNHILLIEAIAELRSVLPHVHVVLVGEGECRVGIESQSASFGISDRVHFLGIRQDIPELLWMSDVFVMCSLSEGLPLSLLEAAAAEVPIVIAKSANRAGFVRNEVNGYIAENHPRSLARLLLKVLQGERGRLETMTQNARMAVVKDFSIETMVGKYDQLYQRLLQQKHMIE